MCCGTDVLGYEQTCCNGVIHNVANGDCCGMAVYSKSDPTLKCCNQTLARASSSSDVCCGSFTYDGGRSQICCGDKVFEKSDYDNCCENPNDATFKEFNSATHYCCGTPQLRNSPTKCCYMRPQGQEKSVPVPYNSNQQCCKYPFITFTQRPANGQCVD